MNTQDSNPTPESMLVSKVELPDGFHNRAHMVHSIDWAHYRNRVADKYGRRVSPSGRNAELLMRTFFEPRVQRGKKWHPCGVQWLANLMDWDKNEVGAALKFLRRKGLITVAKGQYSVTNAETGEHRASPAMYALEPDLVRTELRTLQDAEEVSIQFVYGDGRVTHVALSELGDLNRCIIIDDRPRNFLKVVEEILAEQAFDSAIENSSDFLAWIEGR